MLYQINKMRYDNVSGIIEHYNEDQNESHKLTNIQRSLLNYFIENPKTVLSKQTIMDQVWGRVVTENSVDQIISILRGYLELNPTKPSLIVTHYGMGYSFEIHARELHSEPPIENEPAPTIENKLTKNSTNTRLKLFIFALLLVGIGWVYMNSISQPDGTPLEVIPNKNQKIVVLPMIFADKAISQVEQEGMITSLKSAFSTLNSEGIMIFDETSLTTQQAIEKHWKLEGDLIVLRSNIIKNGDIYEAVIELTNGVNIHKKTTLSANNVNDLLNSQIVFISDYNEQISHTKKQANIPLSSSQKYIQALGYKKSGNLEKAKTLIQQVLQKTESDYQARLILAEILYEQKQYDKSMSQLKTLKATTAYQNIGTEIELSIAKIHYSKHKYKLLIAELMAYKESQNELTELKKAKIKIQLAQAYLALGDIQKAMIFYKQSIANIDEQLNPGLFAQSYHGQGKVLTSSSVNADALSLFQQSLNYAQMAGNIHFQILILNELSLLALTNLDWENAIAYTKQALSLLELNNDKVGMGKGLGNLVAILNLRGQFSEAQQVNSQLEKVAKEIDSSNLQLHYLHYSAILALNEFDWILAQQIINKQLRLAQKTNDYGMQLNNAFLALELILLKKDTQSFMPEWNKRESLIKELRFERYQIYMDLYLARYYMQTFQNQKAINLINQVSEQALQTNDIKILVDAQNRLAETYLSIDAKRSLKILNNMEQYNPHPNPYLDLKAQALYKLGKNIEALSLLNQAKLVYHESWTAKNQAFLESLQSTIN